jgi:probable biosynthetic protein (TIGR04098 family)
MAEDAKALRRAGTTSSVHEFTIALGMQHLGRAGLSEPALFKEAGHGRWTHIERVGGVATGLIHDAEGQRLYATFYYVEVRLPGNRRLSEFGENMRLDLVGPMARFGSQLDGTYDVRQVPGAAVRMSNVFISQERGPSKLTVATPGNIDLSKFDELEAAPDARDLCRRARDTGSFRTLAADELAFGSARESFAYQIDPDRDINGAGLLYFANYVHLFELGERQFLSGMLAPPPDGIIDRRSTNCRQVAYFGNAKASEMLDIVTKLRVESAGLEASPSEVALVFDSRIFRRSDRGLLALSTARKIATIEGAAEVEWVRLLLSSAQVHAVGN